MKTHIYVGAKGIKGSFNVLRCIPNTQWTCLGIIMSNCQNCMSNQ